MLAESSDTPPHAGQPVSRNLPFAYPLEQCARLHLQVLGSLICGKPFCFHVSLFSHSGNARSRRLRGRLCRVLSRKRTRFLHMVAAIIFTVLLEDVSRTLPESPIDLCRAPRCCGYTGATTLRFGRVVAFFAMGIRFLVVMSLKTYVYALGRQCANR